MPSNAAGRIRVSRQKLVFGVVAFFVVAAAAGLIAYRPWRRASAKGPARLDRLRIALDEFNAGNYDAAIATLDRRRVETAPIALDWMLRARIASAQGRPAEAVGHLRYIPDSDPIAPKAWLFTGQIEMARRRTRAAEAAFRRSLDLEPRQVQPHRELIHLYTLQRRKAECDAVFRALASFADLDNVLAFAWSQNSCGLLDPKEAGGILRECIDADPDDRWSRLALAWVCLNTDQHEEVDKILAPLADSDADARAVRIENAMAQGEIEAAEDLAGAGPDDNPRLNLARGQLALRRGNPGRAAEFFRAVLRDDPDNHGAIQGLGLVLRKLEDPEAAKFLERAARQDELKRTIHQAIQADLTDPRLSYKLGSLCEALGLREECRTWYRLVLARDPSHRQAQDALDRLSRGL